MNICLGKLLFPLAMAIGLCACTTTYGPDRATIAQVRAGIERGNGREMVHKYFDCRDGYVLGFGMIVSATPEALELAEEISDYTDACPGEMLAVALSEAMQKNPEGVLLLMERLRYGTMICSPILYDETMSSEAVVKSMDDATARLERVHDPQLARQKQACLAAIAKNRAEFLANPPLR